MKYTAIFSNGKTVSRNSKRNYTHAYMVISSNPNGTTFISDVGFASSKDLATKACKGNLNYVVKAEVVEISKGE